MPEKPNTPQDLVALAEDRQKKEREEKESKEQARLKEAREALKFALPEGSWDALGIDPEAAEARDSGVFAKGYFLLRRRRVGPVKHTLRVSSATASSSR